MGLAFTPFWLGFLLKPILPEKSLHAIGLAHPQPLAVLGIPHSCSPCPFRPVQPNPRDLWSVLTLFKALLASANDTKVDIQVTNTPYSCLWIFAGIHAHVLTGY